MSIDFPREEEATIERWREIKAFERQVRILPLQLNASTSFMFTL